MATTLTNVVNEGAFDRSVRQIINDNNALTVDLDSVQSIAGVKTFSGANVHSGAETHSGNEAFTGSPTGLVVSKTVSFVEDATSVTHTGTVVIPAGATLQEIRVSSSALWTGGTAALSVGDAEAATGWFNAVNLKATDLLVGEVLSIASSENWGGKQGAYLVAASGVKGQATASKAGTFYVTAGSVIGVISVGAPATTAGRTYMTVTYSVGTAVVPVLA